MQEKRPDPRNQGEAEELFLKDSEDTPELSRCVTKGNMSLSNTQLAAKYLYSLVFLSGTVALGCFHTFTVAV